MLLAVLLSFSRLSSDSEIVALWAGGISLKRLLVPVLALAFTVTLLSFVTSEWLAPQTHRQSSDLMERVRGNAAVTQKPFIISDLEQDRYNAIVIVNKGISPGTKELRDVTIFRASPIRARSCICAERAQWGGRQRLAAFQRNGQRIGPGVPCERFSGLEPKTIKLGRTPDEVAEEQRDSDGLTFRQLLLTEFRGCARQSRYS